MEMIKRERIMLYAIKKLKIKDWILTVLSVGMVILSVFLELQIPDFMRTVIEILTGASPTANMMNDVLYYGGLMLACAVGGTIATAFSTVVSSYISSLVAYYLREAVFNHVTDLDTANVKNFSTASLLTRTTNDVSQIEMIIAFGTTQLIKAPVMAIWAVCKIIDSSWQLSLLTAAAVVVIAGVVLGLITFLVPRFKIVQKLLDSINRVARENLSGMKVVRAFNAEAYEQEKFGVVNKKLTDLQLGNRNFLAIINPLMLLVLNGLSLGIYWLGSYLISGMPSLAEQQDLYAGVVVFGSYALYVIQGFIFLAMVFMMWPQARVSASRISEVLKTPVRIKSGSVRETKIKGEIEFRDVSFHYEDGGDVLKHISFKASPGETIAFIGATGCGKSTLVGLAARLYDPSEGEILFDGVNIKDFDLDTLYEKIGYVPQKAVLFSDSIADNIKFGDEEGKIDDAEIGRALSIAQAKDFVSQLPEGTSFQVAQGGSNLSGGQKQRLSIARAIAKNPEILIFDDSFSALDFATDKALREELSKSLKGTTVLIVGQRIASIKDADRIIVLEKGEIVGEGKHQDLLRDCPVYREIALSQFSEEEIESEMLKGGN